MQATEQQLTALRQLLLVLGMCDKIDHHILYPGHRREQLIRGLMSRLLGGKSIDDLPFNSSTLPDGLAEDERFAERCRQLLCMFGITASKEQIRGCSSNQHQDTALLLQLAQLSQAVKQQRHTTASATTASPSPLPSDAAVTQLIGSACGNVSRLTSDVMQLFAADMSDALKTYSDQLPAQHVPQQRHYAQHLVKHLQQQLQQLVAAGGDRCQNALSETWQQQVIQVEAALDTFASAVQHFDQTYQQELSVWAEVANEEQYQLHGLNHGLGHGGDSTMQVIEGVGMAARCIVSAYKGVTAALEGFASITKHHQALQEVPSALLNEQKTVHSDEARMYSSAAAVLK